MMTSLLVLSWILSPARVTPLPEANTYYEERLALSQRVSKVKVGMTTDQVRDLVGPPERSLDTGREFPREPWIIWCYEYSLPNGPIRIGEVWFDKSNRVIRMGGQFEPRSALQSLDNDSLELLRMMRTTTGFCATQESATKLMKFRQQMARMNREDAGALLRKVGSLESVYQYSFYFGLMGASRADEMHNLGRTEVLACSLLSNDVTTRLLSQERVFQTSFPAFVLILGRPLVLSTFVLQENTLPLVTRLIEEVESDASNWPDEPTVEATPLEVRREFQGWLNLNKAAHIEHGGVKAYDLWRANVEDIVRMQLGMPEK